MIVLSTIPVALSSLLMAAHLYRHGLTILAVVCLLLPLLLISKNRWVPRTVTAVLFVYALEWVRTLIVFIGYYSEHGQPVTRLTMILGTVALITLLSSLVFRTKPMKRRYNDLQKRCNT